MTELELAGESLPVFKGSERTVGNAVTDSLRSKGFRVQREARTPSGPVDVHAYQQHGNFKANHHFIEIKMRSDRRTAAHAMGQLLFYESEYFSRGSCGLWFASPEPPDERTLKVLEMYGVKWCSESTEGIEAFRPEEVERLYEARDKAFLDMFIFGGAT